MALERTFHRLRSAHPAYRWPVQFAVEEPPIVYLPEGSQSLPSRAPRARRAAAEAYWHRIWPEPGPVNLPDSIYQGGSLRVVVGNMCPRQGLYVWPVFPY